MIENIVNSIPNFVADAALDTLKLIPSLIIIFVFIEIFENFFAHKIADIVSFSKKLGPMLGALLAIIPQCGFSVLMTTLFIRKYVTIGTLVAVYIATSDEAIPILLANPNEYKTVIKIIVIKFLLGVAVGYLLDLLIKPHLHKCEEKEPCSHLKAVEAGKGCCSHEITENKIKNIIIHPIKHTLIISIFIFAVCLILNYLFTFINEETFANLSTKGSIIEITFFSLFGLIPNCAVSVLITMLYLKGAILFGSVISGLSSNAGLGLLILFTKKESWKSFLTIVSILVTVGFCAGCFLEFIM